MHTHAHARRQAGRQAGSRVGEQQRTLQFASKIRGAQDESSQPGRSARTRLLSSEHTWSSMERGEKGKEKDEKDAQVVRAEFRE